MIVTDSFGSYRCATISDRDLEVSVLTRGAIVQSIACKGRQMVLGHGDPAAYERDMCYVGAIVGRYANRIARARFELDGIVYRLAPNEGENQNHGGPDAFDKRSWDCKVIDDSAVEMHLFSPDGDNGYPGDLDAYVTYRASGNRLRVEFRGRADRKTVFAPTTHIYFNIGGRETIQGTELSINAEKYVKVDAEHLPLSVEPCAGDFDFRRAKEIPENMDAAFVLEGERAAVIRREGVQIAVSTDYPALQLYSGDFLSGGFRPYQGFALEPEYLPDSPNRPDFPSPVLEPGDVFVKYIEYEFGEV